MIEGKHTSGGSIILSIKQTATLLPVGKMAVYH